MSAPGRRHRGKLQKHIYIVVIIVSVGAICLDVGLILHHAKTNRARQTFVSKQVSTAGSKNVPSSTKPSTQSVQAYSVAPNLPKYLVIPSLNVNARVTKVYTNAQNQVGAPGNIFDTGWYASSSLPGQPGATFIDGHVSSWTADGVFYNLKKLRVGDTIQIVKGDNSVLTYLVKKMQATNAPDVDMQQALTSIEPGKSGLNLMTCTGSVIAGTSEFNERLIVYSVLE